jgi:murein endopeptidase
MNSIYMLYMTITYDQHRIQKRIASIQSQLAQLGPMRPGCLSRQYREPKLKKGPYYQLSYTARMKSRTEYIHPDLVPQIERELAEYRRYRELTQEWVQLSIESSRWKIKQWKQTAGRTGQPA